MKEKSKILRKLTAALLLNVFSFNILADGLQVNPNSRYNTSLDRAQNGVPVVNISTPNGRGVSINEFLEYNVGREGQVLNNADNIGRSHLAGIINANPNLGPNQAANLILLQVNGANRSQIEGYIEALSRQKVNVILSNENGIYLNGAGTINIKNFIPTTGKVKLKDGDVIGIDVEKGRVIIGAGGFDATNTDYVNVIAKAMELQGNLVGNKVDVTLGENAVDSNGTVTSKNGINSVAIDASNLGSMYAGQIKIVSTDKGAGVNSNGLIYSRDTKLEITADGKINVAKIKGDGIEINGTEYAQSELASSDKGININAAKIKLDGQTQANEDINLNGNVENKSNIYAGGNLNTLDMINSGNINASGNITAKDFRNSLATVLSGGNFNVKNLDNSGNIQVSGITDINGKFDNTGALTSVKRISVLGNVSSTGNILTNEDLTAKNTVTSGAIVAKNLRVDNLANDGKISTNGELTAKDVKNTGEILSSGKILGNSFVTSGKVQTNEALDINGFLDNSGTVGASKDISVAGNVLNSGEILTNGDFTSKNMDTSGTVVSNNLRTGNLQNDGKIIANGDLKAKKVKNTKDITAIGKISSGNIDNSGKLLANDTISAKNIKNATSSSKIAAGKGVTGERVENSGTFATNGDIKATSSLVNSGTVDGKGIDIAGADFVNSGKINADNIKANVVNTRNDGFIYSGNDVDLTTGTLINTKEITAVNNVNAANANVTNSGKIASNNRVLLDNSAITNTGEILSGEIFMRNAQKFNNTGTVRGNNVELGVNQNINLTGNLHGQHRLKISANNITNNGNTTGTGLIEINSNDFTNNRELASDTVVVNGRGEVVNNSMITGNNGKVSGRNITNNDLVAFENSLEMNVQGKVHNNKGKVIYGGQALVIRANEIMNDEAEILGGNMDLNATKITNNVGTIQSTGNITITSSDFQNIGRVSNLGNYEKYFETWDNRRLSETEVLNGWVYHHGDDWDKSSNGSRTRKARYEQRAWFETFIRDTGGNSLLLTKYQNDARNALNNGYQRLESESARYPEVALKGKIESRATTEYGKVLASGNITINSANFKNRDSIISGGGLVNITATNFENSVTTGNPVQLQKGKEKLELEIRRYTKRKRPRVKMVAYFHRELTAGDIGYESGQPSVIEGQQVVVSAPNIIQNPIEAGNGKVLNNGGAIGRTLLSSTSVGMNKGTSSANGQVQAAGNTLLSKVNSTFNRAVQIAGNNSGIKDIKNTGIISVNPILSSVMFTTNINPSSKYLMETRSKYISLGQYFGSDYFTSRIGYSEIWDRTRRLGDAYYENQLLTRALAEKLGTSFINGKSNQELIKAMMDNASAEGTRLGLTVGQELTQDQINSLNEDIVWYVTKNVNGIEVLAPQVYLSKNTRSIINDDTRNRVGGINGTYIQTNNLVNNGTKYGNGGITVVNANTVRNETATNLLSEISGDRTYINAAGNIENIGGLIGGRDLVSVVSQNGDVINRTTTREVGYNNGEFDRTRFTDVVSVAEISSKNGPAYIQGKNYTSTGAITAGNTVRIDASENVNINALKLTGEQKFGRNGDNYGSYGFVNHLQSAVNGTDGVMITSGKDTNISGSQVASLGNVNINAQNINVTNVVNNESIESKRVNSGFISTETKTNSAYIESNQGSRIFGNNVILDSKKDTNVIASDITASKDELGNGGNILVTAGNNVNILSDTTSQSSSSTASKTKSIGSLNVGSKGRADGMAQVIQNSSHLSANGGNIVVKSGKDTLIGASELQSTESIGLVAGGNVVVTGLDEKYGESSSKSKGGMFRGGHLYKGNSESEKNQSITNKESVIRAGKDIVVKGENVGILGSDFDAGQDINVDAKNGIIVKSRNEVYSSENQKNETKVGFFAKGHNLSFEAGIEAKSKSDASATKQIRPDESTLVANGNINLKSGENIYFEGDAASGQDINLDSKNIFIADSEGRVEYTNESKEKRVSVGVDMNFNNLSDTFTSIARVYFKPGAFKHLGNLKEFGHYFGDIKAIGHLSDLTSFAGDLLSGKSLLESLDGREDTINGINHFFAGLKEGSGKAGIYAKASINASENRGSNGTIERTSLTAGGNINLKGDNSITIRGTDIKGFNDVNIETKNLDIQASKSSMNSKNSSFGLSGEINVLDPSLSLSGNISRGKTEGYTYNNTTIDAGNKLHINIENGAIKGANISGNDVYVNVKGNLEIASLQDYEKTSQRSVGGTVGNVTGNARSYSGQVGVTNGTKNWVGEQTSIIGRNSIRVDVGNKLTLTGAKISNEENGIDKGNLVVRAKEIEARDIEGNDDLMSVNVEGSLARRDIEHKQKNGKKAHEKYENDGAVTVEGHEREQIARATIGNGTIEGNVSGGIHRDIKTSSEITKGVEVKPVRVEYNDERTDWGSTNKILTQNAGTIGKFLDDIGVPKLDKGITPAGQKKPEELRKSNEEFFKEITYTNIRKVEDIIDKTTGNYIHGLIPTSGVNGGLMEQIPKFVLEDENKIYKIVTVVRNGNEYVTVKEIDRLDSAELKRIKDERKLFINGMNEPLEKAISNSVKQYKEVSNNGKELPDGVYETTLLYNPSRGFLWDAAEAGLGKVFNGKGASLGVMRGLETALKTNDPNQKYEARFYSQGNINGDGAFNNMVRRGEYQTMTNFLVSHTGSPSADRRFQKGTSETQERLGYTNIGSVGNILDGVTSESAGMFGNWTKGLASEMIGTNQTEKNEFIQNNFRNVPVYGDAGAVIQKYPLLEAPLFDDKKIKNTKNGNFIVFTDSEVKEIYEKQFPNGKKNISINQMRKILDSEFSQHRMYFNGDFETVQKLLDIEKKKNEKVLKPEEYQKLIDDENKIRLERQETIKNILTNIYILKPEDLVKQRNEAILPGIMDETPKNESYKNFQKQNIQLPEIPKKENSDPKELKDILNNLRKRVGN